MTENTSMTPKDAAAAQAFSAGGKDGAQPDVAAVVPSGGFRQEATDRGATLSVVPSSDTRAGTPPTADATPSVITSTDTRTGSGSGRRTAGAVLATAVLAAACSGTPGPDQPDPGLVTYTSICAKKDLPEGYSAEAYAVLDQRPHAGAETAALQKDTRQIRDSDHAYTLVQLTGAAAGGAEWHCKPETSDYERQRGNGQLLHPERLEVDDPGAYVQETGKQPTLPPKPGQG